MPLRHLATTVVVVGVVAAIAAGCSTPPDPYTLPPTETYSVAPLPEGASIVTSAPTPTPPVDCGDPTASLRPFPAGEIPPSASLDAIRERGRLVVGLDTGSNLMSFRNPATGDIEGFDVDVAREIARDLLGSPDKVEFRILTSSEREQALKDSRVDIVARTMSITCDRRQRVDFSTVYYQAQQRILVMAGSPVTDVADLAGKRVCAVAGTRSLERIVRAQPDATVVTVPTWSDCLVMLQQRQVDAISTDDTLLAGMSTQDPYLRMVGPSLGPEPYGIGITKGNDDLVRFVNGTLERIRNDGTWERIYQRWLSGLGPSPGPPPPTYRD
ncbi:glutamate ABC transporter substrate-binding protein [Rhodococcus sp. AG1013]|uniref:glutamate ABC transporter substrate-binding protein n=1 Tax=unclassified Rhodococcus (in: high G+C Gram-positive bacteria) TaxID=192944 RepID=UPI000E0C27D6|nr:glutamate ABC transporter substrate-binding protein [Rhodococcus sp. AG1013]RDI26953.1 amino acid ABC transporter substrate-binding protein (PAAT family) [Rhodococcus sp. AG1013]